MNVRRAINVISTLVWLSACEHKPEPRLRGGSPDQPVLPAEPVAESVAARPHTATSTDPCPTGMLPVDGGSFTSEQRATLVDRFSRAGEIPDLRFDVEPFCLAKLETTHSDFRECIVAGACVAGRDFPTPFGPGLPPCMSADGDCPADIARLPVWNVTLDGAKAYCEFRGGRLPTFGEWFWAATGGDEARPYPWGTVAPAANLLNVCDESCVRGACCGDVPESEPVKSCAEPSCVATLRPVFEDDDGYSFVAPVGSYPLGAGRWGHLDLLGNVAEVVERMKREYACGGDGSSEADLNLDLNHHECLETPSGSVRGVRCAASRF